MSRASSAPDPSRTIAILFGASRWERHPALDNEEYALAYEKAAERVRDYLTSDSGLSLPPWNLLDLFNDNQSHIAQDEQIRDFLNQRISRDVTTCSDVLVYFVGHGTTNRDGRFVFVLRSTERDRLPQTAYSARDLADALSREAPTQRRWLLLDCCASAKAFTEFQPSRSVFDTLNSETSEYFPARGTALFAACSSDGIALADKRLGSTVFTAALFDVLESGNPHLAETLTLSEVATLTRENINARLGPDGVRPEVSDPDQRQGEISRVPFFPNPARLKHPLEAGLQQQRPRLRTGIGRTELVAVATVNAFSLDLAAFEMETRTPTPITHESERVRLAGERLDENAARALKVMQKWRADTPGLAEVLVAPELRNTENGPGFVGALRLRLPGVPITVLSEDQKVEYSAMGVLCGIPTADGILANIDGGSLELVRLDRGARGVSHTFSLGAIRLTERAGGDLASARAIAEADLASVSWLAEGTNRDLYLAGGWWRALARIHMAQTGYPLQMVHHYTISREEARDLTAVIAGASRRALERLPGLSRRRIDGLPYAAVVLRRVLRETRVRRVVFSTNGLREGWFMLRMPDEIRRQDPLLFAAREMARLGRNLSLPSALFDWTQPLFPQEIAEARRLREAACWLSDIGSHDHSEFRAEQAFLRVLRQPGIGLDHHARAFLAMAVAMRYEVDADAPFLRPARLLLDVLSTHRAEVLGVALGLAYTLSAAPDVLAGTSLLLRDSRLGLLLQKNSSVFAGENVMRRLDRLAQALGLEAFTEEQ